MFKLFSSASSPSQGAIAVYPTATENQPECTELELVRRSRKGDTEAYAELVRKYQQVVFNIAYRFMRDVSLAEDMAQEAFIKAFKHIKGFRGDCSFSTWLYRVTCSVCLTELSRRKKRCEVGLQPNTPVGSVESKVNEYEIAEKIRECVTRLSDRYATVLTLYYLNGISYEEIAEIMDIPVGTLKTWMFRARKQLRKVVEKEIFPNGKDTP
ncbi:MAG TPA: RNA polymerase sigma factor [Candidatus Hydrogenedens sp.]|nr:RNA polymerase sigma factor [Candidatus Hydrogenedens sp.]HOK09959.1 RNA polymerase sigma factor [Candidatus Hydrogenedens sp.]HOL19706.1 RNA polymerase sigma factor [Candidatus Hydrogenedens sp.]HPP59950.1 RNA polymerase sigma factor [Candidatus Hydrogenedens sp.]